MSKNRCLTYNFTLYTIGETISSIGDSFYSIGYIWLVLNLSQKSGITIGSIMGIYGIVSLFSQPIAGVYADRLNKKKLMILTDIIQAIICFTLFLLIVNDSLHLFHLYCASILFAIASPFFERTGFSLIPQIVGKDSLLRANSIFEGIQTMAKIVPPALAGVIIKVLGLKILFLLNGVSFLFSALCILFIQIKSSLKKDSSHFKFIKELKEGFVYIVNVKFLYTLMIYAILLNFFASPVFPFLPIVARIKGFGPQGYGFLSGAISCGWLIGSLFLGLIGSKARELVLILVGLFLSAFSVFIMGFIETLIVFIFVSFGFGISLVLINTPILTIIQKYTPPDKIGRVSSLLATFSGITAPLGFFISGVIVDIIPVGTIFKIIGVIIFTFTVGGSKVFFSFFKNNFEVESVKER